MKVRNEPQRKYPPSPWDGEKPEDGEYFAEVLIEADLRDHFAGLAMQAYVGDPSWRLDMDMDRTARAAYQIADAMLKARQGGG